ncbi:hypothetical protein V7083_22195, partial [Bacillus sp. JJ1764]
VTVSRKTYNLGKNQVGKSKIDKYLIDSKYSYVTGSHTLYPGVLLKRTIIYFKESNSIIIHDRMSSSAMKTYSQIFNIGKDVN